MTLNELIKIVDGRTNIDSNKKINKLKTDTRKLKKGDIFIALKGNNYDGHNYIKEAIKKGYMPVHASAISKEGKGYMFFGDRNTGKSK